MKEECDFTWFGQSWKCMRVRRDDSIFGGECDLASKQIVINYKYDDETFLDYLHHELVEGATYLTACAYTRMYPDKEDIFVMNHAQMDVMSSAVRGAYEMVKKNIGAINGWPIKKKAIKKTSKKPTKRTKRST
ncbi:MAG: hypothetical protein GF334_05200 [Candidatus Altiarchaeales archaeon]|nr:hypothetical protein [Candidatus Altiarchaeales archaeon]